MPLMSITAIASLLNLAVLQVCSLLLNSSALASCRQGSSGQPRSVAMPDAESVDPPLVAPRRNGLQDPVGRRRRAEEGGHIITIGSTDGRDATNLVH